MYVERWTMNVLMNDRVTGRISTELISEPLTATDGSAPRRISQFVLMSGQLTLIVYMNRTLIRVPIAKS